MMDKGRTCRIAHEIEIQRKRVLIIAYGYPPAGGVGTVRVAKFVKYLPDFGWEPAVLTAEEGDYVSLDRSFERDVPQGIHIYRLPLCKFGLVNDEGIRWLPNILRSVRHIVRREKPVVAYITGGPFFPFVVGPIIKWWLGVPYVIDFRDPWRLANRKGTARKRTGVHAGRVLASVLEPIIIHHASRVVCATEQMSREHRAAYGNEPRGKFVTVTNGFDPEDFDGIRPRQFEQFTVVYAGKFRVSIGFRDPGAFFGALRLLDEEGLRIRFVHVGATEPEVAELASAMGVSNVSDFVGQKPYSEALSYAKGADLLLLIGTGEEIEQTGKVFDYIACRRPILALAPKDGAIAEVVKQVPFARIAANPNSAEIARLIREVYEEQRGQSDLFSEPDCVRQYYRYHLTQTLAMTLDGLLDVSHQKRIMPCDLL